MDKWQFIEQYASQDGWFRIFPLGMFSRLGRTVELTREKLAEMVQNFQNRIPGFKLPIKRTHDGTTGKLGDVADLELRADGLYARPEWLPSGQAMLEDGSFQYLSPEVVWGPTDYNGAEVSNLLMGVAVLNDPFFPEAALYSAQDAVDEYKDFSPDRRKELAQKGFALPDGSYPIENASDLSNAIAAIGRAGGKRGQVIAHIKKRARALKAAGELSDEQWARIQEADWFQALEEDTLDENTLKKSFSDALKEVFGSKPPEPQEPAGPTPEEFAALKADKEKAEKEAQELRDAAEKAEQEKARAARVEQFQATLAVEQYAALKGVPELLAEVGNEELAGKLAEQFKALAAQAEAGDLFGERGSNQPGSSDDDPMVAFEKAAAAYAKEADIDINEAYSAVSRLHPDIYNAYRRAASNHKEA
jgi:hypothetical protein